MKDKLNAWLARLDLAWTFWVLLEVGILLGVLVGGYFLCRR